MKIVYSLSEDLSRNPKRVELTQARTLDDSDLPGGLKATYGLFGSDEWWHNVFNEVIPITRLSGVITRIYREGMHNEGLAFEMEVSDGSTFRYSCVVNKRRNRALYQVGKGIRFEYATVPLKNPIATSDGYETTTRMTLKVELERNAGT